MEETEIQKWFTGRHILLTGGTGFVGSVILEKLLRSCSGIEKIHVLVRDRHGQTAVDRLKATLNLPLFSVVDEVVKKKAVVLDGDITKVDFGLSKSAFEEIKENVSVIFHVAASTNFSSSLVQAVNTNLLGTHNALALAKKLPHLKGFLYVSTAYCNAMMRGLIMESAYPATMKPEELLQTCQSSLEKMDYLAARAGHPNTYSFTKQLSEELLRSNREHVPVAIVRPSLVLGCLDEPVPGWLSNVQNGGMAFIAGAGKGVFRTVLGSPHHVADIVPVDLVANMCIAALWDIVANPSSSGFSVFHCTSGEEKPITWGSYCDMVIDAARKYPSQEMVWYPAAKCRTNPIRSLLFFYIFQLLPAYGLQLWENSLGKKRPVITYQQKFLLGMHYVEFFTTRTWNFDIKQKKALKNRLSEKDQRLFNFDMDRIYWPTYLERCVLGVRHYYHGDYPASLDGSRKLLSALYIAHYTLFTLIFLVVSYILIYFGVDILSSFLAAAMLVLFLLWI